MTERTKQPPMPAAPFKLLVVEGGDEEAVCKWLIGDALWKSYWCWTASSQSRIPGLAAAASRDANFGLAQSVGIVFDVEADLPGALDLAEQTFAAFGVRNPGHGKFTSSVKNYGLFMSPDGSTPGAIEKLCRKAANRADTAQCVDAYEKCAGVTALTLAAHADKRWVNAYIAAVLGPRKFLPDALEAGLFDQGAFAELKAFLLAL